MPYSPRWLISKGRIDEARRVLAQQHANGDTEDALVEWEMREIIAALETEHAINQDRSVFAGWSDFVKTPGNRKRLWVIAHVGIGAQWNGVGIVSYYLVPVLKSVGITSSKSQTLVNGGLAVSLCVYDIPKLTLADLQFILCRWWCRLSRKIGASTIVAPVDCRHADLLRHHHCTFCCFHKRQQAGSWRSRDCLLVPILWQ